MIPCPEPRGYPGNLGLLFAEHADAARAAIVDLRDPVSPRLVSYRALDAACNAVARGLARSGLKPGDRIGILSLNRAACSSCRSCRSPVPMRSTSNN